MKYFLYSLSVFILFAGCGKKIPSTAKKEIFHVSGNCGMCKKTIEKSVNTKGVINANWDKKTKMMTIVYDTTLISINEIKKRIAHAGYDNDLYSAEQEEYNGLHGCCKYPREQ